MNFEELKSEWDKTPDNEAIININKTKKSILPIENIRNNMKMEFWSTTISTFISAFFPQIFGIRAFFYTPYYFLYAFYCLLAVNYLYTFYKFYYDLQDYSGNSKMTLQEIYYEIRLKIETYKTYGYSLTPYIMASIAILISDYFSPQNASLSEIISNYYQYPLIFFIVSIIGYYFLYVKYIDTKYNIHLNYIKSILNNLDDVDSYKASIETPTKNYGFIHAMITGKGDKMKSFITMIIGVSLILIGYLVGQWFKKNGF